MPKTKLPWWIRARNRVYFEPRDLWMGVLISRDGDVWFNPLPCIQIAVRIRSFPADPREAPGYAHDADCNTTHEPGPYPCPGPRVAGDERGRPSGGYNR